LKYRISYILEGRDEDVSQILEAAEENVPELHAQLEALDLNLRVHDDGPLVETLS
jgi:hypothetical protein